MSGLRDALPQYVALRRALGTKLQEPARTLERFLDFLECEGSEFIKSELASAGPWNRKVSSEPHGRGGSGW
jgi:integrase/recombinase XerD